MTTEPPEDYGAFLKQQIIDAYYPDGMTPEEAAEFEAYGRLRAAMDAEDEAFRQAVRYRLRQAAVEAPDALRSMGIDVPDGLTFTVEEA